MNNTKEIVKDFPDLGGDYDNHTNSLERARKSYDAVPYQRFATAYSSEMHQSMQFPYDMMYQGPPHMHYTANGFSQINNAYQGPHYYHQVLPSTVYAVDESSARHRGTGAYLSILHNGGSSYGERYLSGRRGNGPSFPHNNNNNRRANRHGTPNERFPRSNPTQENQFLPAALPIFGLLVTSGNGNGFISALERVEFGSFGRDRDRDRDRLQ